MATDFMPQTGPSMTPSPGHQPNELRIRAMVIFTLALMVTSGAVMVGMGYLMNYFTVGEQNLKALAPPRFKNDVGPFPSPRLQSNPGADLTAFKAAQLAELKQMGWVDQSKNVARVPIDRAMDLYASGTEIPWPVLKSKTSVEMRATLTTTSPQPEKK